MPKSPARIDLGDEFPDNSDAELDVVVIGPMWGRDWRVVRDMNTFTLLAAESGDAAAFPKLIANAIHPDDRVAFLDKLNSQKGFDAPELLKLAKRLVEAAAGDVPTITSSASSAGTRRRAAATR